LLKKEKVDNRNHTDRIAYQAAIRRVFKTFNTLYYYWLYIYKKEIGEADEIHDSKRTARLQHQDGSKGYEFS